MQIRLRECFSDAENDHFDRPGEIAKATFSRRRKNMNNANPTAPAETGRGPVGEVVVVAAKNRKTKRIATRVVKRVDKHSLHESVKDDVAPPEQVYTDRHKAYTGLPNPHATLKRSASQFVNDMAHASGAESFLSLLRRGYHGTCHKMSVRQLPSYIPEFEGRHNDNDLDTALQVENVVSRMVPLDAAPPGNPCALGNTAMSVIVKWTGASGRKYQYHAWSISSRPGSRDEEGNYIFARLENGYWVPLYVGQGNLQQRYDAALREGCVTSMGASHYHVHLEYNRQRRIQEETDIIDGYPKCRHPTGCNRATRR